MLKNRQNIPVFMVNQGMPVEVWGKRGEETPRSIALRKAQAEWDSFFGKKGSDAFSSEPKLTSPRAIGALLAQGAEQIYSSIEDILNPDNCNWFPQDISREAVEHAIVFAKSHELEFFIAHAYNTLDDMIERILKKPIEGKIDPEYPHLNREYQRKLKLVDLVLKPLGRWADMYNALMDCREFGRAVDIASKIDPEVVAATCMKVKGYFGLGLTIIEKAERLNKKDRWRLESNLKKAHIDAVLSGEDLQLSAHCNDIGREWTKFVEGYMLAKKYCDKRADAMRKTGFDSLLEKIASPSKYDVSYARPDPNYVSIEVSQALKFIDDFPDKEKPEAQARLVDALAKNSPYHAMVYADKLGDAARAFEESKKAMAQFPKETIVFIESVLERNKGSTDEAHLVRVKGYISTYLINDVNPAFDFAKKHGLCDWLIETYMAGEKYGQAIRIMERMPNRRDVPQELFIKARMYEQARRLSSSEFNRGPLTEQQVYVIETNDRIKDAAESIDSSLVSEEDMQDYHKRTLQAGNIWQAFNKLSAAIETARKIGEPQKTWDLVQSAFAVLASRGMYVEAIFLNRQTSAGPRIAIPDSAFTEYEERLDFAGCALMAAEIMDEKRESFYTNLASSFKQQIPKDINARSEQISKAPYTAKKC